jgi:hypothetical protein
MFCWRSCRSGTSSGRDSRNWHAVWAARKPRFSPSMSINVPSKLVAPEPTKISSILCCFSRESSNYRVVPSVLRFVARQISAIVAPDSRIPLINRSSLGRNRRTGFPFLVLSGSRNTFWIGFGRPTPGGETPAIRQHQEIEPTGQANLSVKPSRRFSKGLGHQ